MAGSTDAPVTIGRLMTREGVHIRLDQGDITTQQVDVLVNSTSENFSLSHGNLSQAVLQAAGSTIQKECSDNKPKKYKAGQVVQTTGGLLPVLAIYHGHIVKWKKGKGNEVLVDFIKNCLDLAHIRGIRSIAIPAIGAGVMKFPHQLVAELMFAEVLKFSERYPGPCTTLKDIRIVVKDDRSIEAFKKHFDVIVDVLAKESRADLATPPSSPNTDTPSPPTTDPPQSLLPPHAEPSHAEPPHIEPSAPSMTQIKSTDFKIDDDISKLKIIGNADSSNVRDQVPPPGKYQNLYPAMSDMASNNPSKYPSNWVSMSPGEANMLVELSQTSFEFQQVAKNFYEVENEKTKAKHVKLTITKIQRVQCPRVYERYQVEKAKMGLIFHATNIAVDKTLYHGAESKCMDQIIAYGFDVTECAGKDDAKYGKGIYFPSFSANAVDFAPADHHRFRRVSQCKVLTGLYAVGKKMMTEPPPKHHEVPTIRYDSLVNRLKKPSIYVIFEDSHAYPEYIITFV